MAGKFNPQAFDLEMDFEVLGPDGRVAAVLHGVAAKAAYGPDGPWVEYRTPNGNMLAPPKMSDGSLATDEPRGCAWFTILNKVKMANGKVVHIHDRKFGPGRPKADKAEDEDDGDQ